MKIEMSKQRKYLIKLLILIFVCEVMIQVNNRIIQTFGICTLPFIFIYGYLLFKTEKEQNSK